MFLHETSEIEREVELQKIDIITVKVDSLNKARTFLEKCLLLNGKARLIQGETNIPNTSKLGILSLCDGNIFNIKFIDTPDDEIAKFNEYKA
jgi:hypothetical protein